MRFTTIRAAAKARRRFINEYDPHRHYVYRVVKMRKVYTNDVWFEVDISNRNGTFLTIL
jgi:hypothetical protein